MDIHFSSKTDLWYTPRDFFDKLNRIYSFDLDPCATHENAKCEMYFTKEQDGLKQDWSGHKVFMNPPYGRVIKDWMKKAYESSLNGALVVCLVLARTDTFWWHEYAMKGRIEFIRGRLKFGGCDNAAPFPSAVVVFGADMNSNI
jgi:site-specific DNA-methyltransferase (adenine-specific)